MQGEERGEERETDWLDRMLKGADLRANYSEERQDDP